MWLRGLLVVALSGGAILSAHAADQSVPRGPSYYPDSYRPTSIDWTGWYVGVQLGGAFGNASGLSASPKPAGIIGGGQFGVNWMRDSFLLGAEMDFAGMDLASSATDGAGFTHRVSAHWLSLITGRAGFAVNQFLFYAKGGFAFGSERNTVVNPAGMLADSGTTTQTGWTVGGGVEYAFTPHWSARLEYDFVDLPSHGIVLTGPTLGSQPANIDFTIQKLVGGVNYRF